MIFNRINRYLPGILILFIGIIYVVLSFNIQYLGDDLGFFDSYASQDDKWYSLPRFFYRHWIWCNGRIADKIAPIGLNILPIWGNAIFNGIFTAAFFYIILKFIANRKPLPAPLQVIIIALITFTFRWDALWMEFITQYNYVFTALFGLCALMILLSGDLSRSKPIQIISVPFCFFAAAMHEAMGLPMAVGLILWFISARNWNTLSKARKLMAIMMIVGGIFPITAPSSWERIGKMLQPEPFAEMMILSAGWLCLLLIAIAFTSVRNPYKLQRLIRSPWIIYLSASILSCCLMLLSQFGGRTGWFCQIFSMIALGQLIDWSRYFKSKWWFMVAWIVAATVIFHYIGIAVWQKRVNDESKEVIALYRTSDTGLIFYDYHADPDLPCYLLHKVHGVPDDDDTYYRYRLQSHYGHQDKPLTILPTEARAKLSSITDSISFRNRFSIRTDSYPDYIITTAILPNEYGDSLVREFPRIFTIINGREYIRNNFNYNSKTLYLYSLVDRDRGE